MFSSLFCCIPCCKWKTVMGSCTQQLSFCYAVKVVVRRGGEGAKLEECADPWDITCPNQSRFLATFKLHLSKYMHCIDILTVRERGRADSYVHVITVGFQLLTSENFDAPSTKGNTPRLRATASKPCCNWLL